jgi:hypothetical protein
MFEPSSIFLSIERTNRPEPTPEVISLSKFKLLLDKHGEPVCLKHLPLAELPGVIFRKPAQRAFNPLQISVVRHSWGRWRDDLKRASVEISHGCTPAADVCADRSSLKLQSSSISTEAIA